MIRLLEGDCRDILPTMPEASVNCIVTSPPYFGLRDYGVDGQMGLEATPDEFVAGMVAVFAERRRVLRNDGTLWLNIGDSYATGTATVRKGGKLDFGAGTTAARNETARFSGREQGYKPKDLLGIPWMLATALRDPHYAGRIKREVDRVWLAAMIDAEGCIFIHRRKAGQHNGQGYYRQNDSFGVGLEVANTCRAVVDRCAQITGLGSICEQGPDETGGRRKQMLYRWNLRTVECAEILREVYPYLVAKQQQARIGCACEPSGEKAAACHQALIDLHRGRATSVDFNAPRSLFEPGWYLRQDIVWSKPNPMPESVTDRCTKSHEYLFLLSKSPRYYFDADAIAEPLADSSIARLSQPTLGEQAGSDRVPGKTNGAMKAVSKYKDGSGAGMKAGHETKGGISGEDNLQATLARSVEKGNRNKRSVWTIATQPFKEAHFATFPPALVEPCILAGCPPGGVVLDPFGGAGTTGLVADRLQREAILIELNPEYAEIARRRIVGDAPLFAEVTAS